MLNVETESNKINILSSQLLIFPCISTDYMLVKYKNALCFLEKKLLTKFKMLSNNRYR